MKTFCRAFLLTMDGNKGCWIDWEMNDNNKVGAYDGVYVKFEEENLIWLKASTQQLHFRYDLINLIGKVGKL